MKWSVNNVALIAAGALVAILAGGYIMGTMRGQSELIAKAHSGYDS